MLPYYIKEKLEKEKVDDFVITTRNIEASQIKFANNKIVKTGTEVLIDIILFIAKDKKIVSTSFKEFASRVLDTTIDQASANLYKKKSDEVIKKLLNFVKYIPKNKNYNGIAQGPFKYKKIEDSYDQKVVDLDEKEAVDYVKQAIDLAKKSGGKRSGGIFETQVNKVSIITSSDVEVSDRLTSLYFSIRSNIDKLASGHETSSSRIFNKLDINGAAIKAGEIAKLSKNPKKINPGKYDILFEHLPAASLLNYIADATSIFSVESNLSFFKDKLNKTVASPIVNLIDYGDLPNGLNTIKFDGEGVPVQKTTLIKKGVLKTYLHNTSTAKRYNVKTTANAGLISPQPTNIFLEAGNYKKEELIQKIKNGLYITNIWYTRFNNFFTGDFSTMPRDGAFLIENGKIKYPVKNIRISENMLNILKNIIALGKTQKQIRSWESEIPTVTPLVLVKDLKVTKPLL